MKLYIFLISILIAVSFAAVPANDFEDGPDPVKIIVDDGAPI